MEVMYERVAGLDVHRDTVAVSVRTPDGKGGRQEVRRTFKTMTSDLVSLKEWLKGLGVTHAAIESTSVYWRPVFYMLEDTCKVILVNPAHVKNVPGRKTDMKDCSWLSRLMECGLLEASFIPPEAIRDLRDLTRYRTELTQARTRDVQRLHKFLQDAGIKLSSVASNIMGKSGMEMMKAMIEGTKDPEVLAEMAKGRLRSKLGELRKALEGRIRPHHAFMMTELLSEVSHVEEAMDRVEERIEEAIRPFEEEMKLLVSSPGVDRKAAHCLIAEMGTDMAQFPSEKNLASWTGVCPGNNVSANKRKHGKTRKGNKWLRTILVQISWAAIRAKDTAAGAKYRRLRSRLGNEKKAIFAVAHSMLVSFYHMLKKKEAYVERGAMYYDIRVKEKIKTNCVRRLEKLGFDVTLVERQTA